MAFLLQAVNLHKIRPDIVCRIVMRQAFFVHSVKMVDIVFQVTIMC